MIDARSVLVKSGQAWKLWLAVTGVAMAGGLVVFALSRISMFSRGDFTLVMLAGVFLGIASFFFGCTAIRCPRCHARWFWQAVSAERSDRWIGWLLCLESCPACGAPGARSGGRPDGKGKDAGDG